MTPAFAMFRKDAAIAGLAEAASDIVAPASPQVAYRALLERALAAHRKKLAAFSALGGDCGSQRGPGSVIILRTISRSALTSAIRRFVSSPLSACAGALSGGLEDRQSGTAEIHRRGPQASQGARRSLRTPAQDDAPSEPGSAPAPCCRR